MDTFDEKKMMKRLEKAERQTNYYKKIADKAGKLHAQETETLSLIAQSYRQVVKHLTREIGVRQAAEIRANESHELLLKILDSIDATIYVADMETHRIMFANKKMEKKFNRNLIGEKCFEVFRGIKSPCDHCTNDQLLDSQGNPAGLISWQGQNPITKEWYVNNDRAIKWPTGKFVRIQIATDITLIKDSEKALKKTLNEKGILLKEIHHRIKNNLQMVSSLLSLQANNFDDQKIIEAFMEAENRVYSMSVVHEILYQSDNFSSIKLQTYLENLLEHIIHIYYNSKNTVDLEINASGVTLDLEQAFTCGLIITELIINALKYAFPNGMSGNIEISAKQNTGNTIELNIADNGVGLPKNFDWLNSKTLGFRLVRELIQGQLEGSWSQKKSSGVCWVIKWQACKGKDVDIR